jgi:hypothetical protein
MRRLIELTGNALVLLLVPILLLTGFLFFELLPNLGDEQRDQAAVA